MSRCCAGDALRCVVCRLSRGNGAIGLYKALQRGLDDGGAAQYIGDAWDQVKAVYPDFDGMHSRRHHRDREVLTTVLRHTAVEVGRQQLALQAAVLDHFRDAYLTGPDAPAARTVLGHSLRAWLPFVSRSPFVVMDDVVDAPHWSAEIPEGPAPPQLLEPDARFEDDDVDAEVDATSQGQRDHERREYEQGRGLRYVAWRTVPSEAGRNHPLVLALNSIGIPGGGPELRTYLYEVDPILLLVPGVASPPAVEAVLRAPAADRDRLLADLAQEATEHLVRAHRALRTELRRDEPDWGTLRPLLEGASALLRVEYADVLGADDAGLASLLAEIIDDLEPWTLRDTVNVVAVAAGVAIVVVTLGGALPTVAGAVAGIAVDATALGLGVHLARMENARRETLNSFAQIDLALAVAAPELDVSREVLLVAVMYAVGPIVGGTIAVTRRVLLRRALARAGLASGSAGRGAGRTAGEAVEEVLEEVPPGGRRHGASRLPADEQAVSGRALDDKAVPDRAVPERGCPSERCPSEESPSGVPGRRPPSRTGRRSGRTHPMSWLGPG